MAAPRLAEEAVKLITASIKANISSALSAVRADRADPTVTTEIPPTESYFIFPHAQGYKLPAVFVICENFDFQNQTQGPNFIHALAKINVSVLVEDRDRNKLTKKAWRYQSALHHILHLTQLNSTDNKVKLMIRVASETFSPTYSNAESKDVPQGAFRKEVLIECEVEHNENLT